MSSSPAAPEPRRRRGEVFGYCMFDFANSSFTTLISTVAYSFYFRQAVVGAHDPRADLLWSIEGSSSSGVGLRAIPPPSTPRVQNSNRWYWRGFSSADNSRSRPTSKIIRAIRTA